MDTPRSAVRKLSEVGRVGRLGITFHLKNGRTTIEDSFSETPHKITRLHHLSGSSLAQVILMNPTPGLFGGDRSEIEITVRSGAHAVVTTQASTKVHPGFGMAEQKIRLNVEPEAELHYYSDPLIPFAGSSFRQQVSIQVGANARLYFWDGFAAGRVERGEHWQFHEFSSEVELEYDRQLLFLDRFRILPSVFRSNSPWVMNQFRYLATGLFIDSRLSIAPIHSAAPEAGVDQPATALIVVRAPASDGIAYRKNELQVREAVFAQRNESMPGLRKN